MTDQMTVTMGAAHCGSLPSWRARLSLIQANILFSALDEDFAMYLLFRLYCHHSSSDHHHLSFLQASLPSSSPSPQRSELSSLTKYTFDCITPCFTGSALLPEENLTTPPNLFSSLPLALSHRLSLGHSLQLRALHRCLLRRDVLQPPPPRTHPNSN